jgi:hypothetical protein
LVVLIALVVLVGLLSIPGFPGHNQAALLTELTTSDAGSALTETAWATGHDPGEICASLESEFGVGNHLLKNSRFGWYASVWPSYQALEAFSVTGLVDHDPSCTQDLQQTVRAIDANYWDESLARSPAAFDQGPNPFHVPSDPPRIDDSLWMALSVMRAYSETRDPQLLQRAEAVFRLAVANWDPRRGGIYWEDQVNGATDRKKSVVSNAPAVVLGVELFRETGQTSYLVRSEGIFDWLESNLRDPRTRLYDDGVDDHTSPIALDTVKLTYDEGIVLGAMTALSQVAPARYPAAAARAFAGDAMNYFNVHRSYGQPGFDAIWFENLFWTAGLVGDPSLTRTARASLESAMEDQPKDVSSLLADGSESLLRELGTLQPSSYRDLLPSTGR